MKKKTLISKKDKKIWEDYLKNPNDIFDKENKIKNKTYSRSRYRFDLHGLSLDAANKKVEEIIMFCSKNNYSELVAAHLLLILKLEGVIGESITDKDMEMIEDMKQKIFDDSDLSKEVLRVINSVKGKK